MSKKSFADQINPALQFISQREAGSETEREAEDRGVPEGVRVDPRYVETKSRRLNLLMQPSLYERVKAGARAQGVSVNEFIHAALHDALREE